jgi:uncharacterized protein YggE
MLRFIACATLLLVIGSAQPAFAQINGSARSITATGTGKVSAPADFATFTVGHQIYEDGPASATTKNRAACQELLLTIQNLKFPLSIIAVQWSLQPTAETREFPRTENLRFTAACEFKVRVEASRATEVIEAVAGVKATQIGTILWTAIDSKSLALRASNTAVIAATDNAASMAKQAGVKLGELQRLDNSQPFPQFSAVGNCESSTATPSTGVLNKSEVFTQPNIECTAAVTMVFAIRK